jgi:hypothetical protein
MGSSIHIHVPATSQSVNFKTSVCYAPNFAVTEVVAAARRFVLYKEALTFWRVKTRVVFTVIVKTTSGLNHSHFRGTFHVCLFSNAFLLS